MFMLKHPLLSSIFSFSTDLTLDPIWDQFWSPKGHFVPYDARPGGTHGSIWALVGAQVLTLSATSGESCAKSGYSWPQTCPKSNQNQIFAAFGGLTWAYSSVRVAMRWLAVRLTKRYQIQPSVRLEGSAA